MIRAHRLTKDLLDFLALKMRAKTSREFLQALQAWVGKNLGVFPDESVSAFRLEYYAKISLSELPIEQTNLRFEEELERLGTAPPSTADSLAMRIRDILWSGVTLTLPMVCDQCHADWLRVLQEICSERLVYVCDRCGWAENGDGRWSGQSELMPAHTQVLRAQGLI